MPQARRVKSDTEPPEAVGEDRAAALHLRKSSRVFAVTQFAGSGTRGRRSRRVGLSRQKMVSGPWGK
jgi:hypothetical protein